MVDLISLGGLLLAFFLVVMNGIFVAAEFAFVKVRPTQVNALVEPVLGQFLPAGTVHLVAFVLGFGFITFLHVVFGELAPKTFAIQEAVLRIV